MAEGLEFAISLKDELSESASKAGESLSSLGGEIGGLGGSLEELADPIALVGAALAAMTAVAIGIGAALLEGAEKAIEAKNDFDELHATLQGLSGLDDQGTDRLIDGLDELSAHLPQTRKELGEWSQTMLGAGVAADDLEGRLRAVASAQALMGSQGDEAAKKVTNLFAKISEAEQLGTKLKVNEKMFQGLGVSADDVAKKLGISGQQMREQLKSGSLDAKKFGDALQEALVDKGADALDAMGGRLDVIKKKFNEAVTKQFEDPAISSAIDGFGTGMQKFVGLLDQSSTSGQVLHFFITTIFSTLFKLASKALPYIYLFLLKLETAGLKIYIAFKPVVKHFDKLFQDTKGDALLSIMSALEIYITGSGLALAFVVDQLLTVVGWVMAWYDALDGVEKIGEDIGKSLKSLFSGKEGQGMGGSLIDGLVDGITGGASKVIAKMTELAKSALGSAKKTLGISSPSKEMKKLGDFAGQGFVGGIDTNIDAAAAAGEGLAFAAAGGASSGKTGGASSAGGGMSISFQTGAIQINGAGGQSVLELTEEAVTLIFERIALEQGLVAP